MKKALNPIISVLYSSKDRQFVELLVNALTEEGWDIWWDQSIKFGRCTQYIENVISNSKCGLPVWSQHSVRHGF